MRPLPLVSAVFPRIIFVNRVYWPAEAATAQLLTDLAEGLAARGWPVHVIAAGEASGQRNGVTIHRTGPGEQHGGFLSRVLNYGRFRRNAQRQLATLVGPGDIVVLMTDPPMLGTAASVAVRRGARIVHWIQDIYPEIVTAHVGPIASVPLWPLRVLRNAAWRSATRCVTLGEDMAQAVAREGVPAGHTAIVPNWAPRELQSPPAPADISAQRAAWGLADKFIVAYSGNLGRVHEFAALIGAAERLQSRREIVFLFIGSGARFAEVRSAALTRGLVNIRFLPPAPRARLAVSLAAADAQFVTVRPAFADLVYPSKLVGVLAAGRPVLFVGPPAGDISRLLERTQCGATFAPDQADKLAGAVEQWQADPERCAQLGRRARAAYAAQFTFESALARWEEIFRQTRASA
jgi:colanic acid biosynthesis glycosyl transferase WcaI